MMLARVGFWPAAFSACTNVYASDMPYSTFPSHGSEGAYVASMLLNKRDPWVGRIGQEREVRVADRPADQRRGKLVPSEPPVRIAASVGGSAPTLLTTNCAA